MRARVTEHRRAVLATVCRSFLLSCISLACVTPLVADEASHVETLARYLVPGGAEL